MSDKIQLPQFSQNEKLGLAILLLMMGIVTYYGWRLFWFLTDDAYIAFRYISNSILGHGYVWNPPPFKPIEGYTSFLWVMLLDVIWRLLDIQPPVSANYVSLVFSYLTLLLGVIIALQMQYSMQLKPYRLFLIGLVFVGILSNRTFLAWTSSGLETAMFNFYLTLWIFCILFLEPYSRRWLFGLTFATGLIYLTRPDGLLTTFTTVCLIGAAFYTKKSKGTLTKLDFIAVSPLLIVPTHLFWRLRFYGEFLPNTYYAKGVSDQFWIQSGYRYFLSFVIEYSLWVWFIAFIILLLSKWKQLASNIFNWRLFRIDTEQLILNPQQSINNIDITSSNRLPFTWSLSFIVVSGLVLMAAGKSMEGASIIALIILGVLLLQILQLSLMHLAVLLTIGTHFLYYTVDVGGDHFEFRVYSYLILFIFISFLWILNEFEISIKSSAAVLILFIVLSWPIPWTHFAATSSLMTREETVFMKVSVADFIEARQPRTPLPILAYLQYYDRLQFWLIKHAVGMRHQEHKIFHESLMRDLLSREKGFTLPNEGFPVHTNGSIGVISWILPEINIIDGFGLNDYVIARNPNLSPAKLMAHERIAPLGYVDCFQPNVILRGKEVELLTRANTFTTKSILDCERRYMFEDGFPLDEPDLDMLLNYTIDDEFTLNKIQVAEARIYPNQPIYIRLLWESQHQISHEYELQFHLVNVINGQSNILNNKVLSFPKETQSIFRKKADVLAETFLLKAPDDLEDGVYVLEATFAKPDGKLLIKKQNGTSLRRIVVGSLVVGETTQKMNEPSYLANAVFANHTNLLGFDLETNSNKDALSVSLHWQSTGVVDRDYTTFVHILSSDGEFVGQYDSQPFLPTSFWSPGMIVTDSFIVNLPVELLSDVYQIQVGQYHWPELERVEIVSSNCLDSTATAFIAAELAFNIQDHTISECSSSP